MPRSQALKPARTLYVEEAVAAHPITQRIIKQFAGGCVIPCDHYREVFNPKAKHFRLQKEHPALILAHKPKRLVQPSPYGIGGRHNYYFSHMLNCIYDCKYCFLQGLYASAMLVLFVNYEDFQAEIQDTLGRHPDEDVFFFSGYDCDSLAYEPVSHFVASFLPFFANHPKAILELRTKSAQIRALMNAPVIPNCIVAFSLAPQSLVSAYETSTPFVGKTARCYADPSPGWLANWNSSRSINLACRMERPLCSVN